MQARVTMSGMAVAVWLPRGPVSMRVAIATTDQAPGSEWERVQLRERRWRWRARAAARPRRGLALLSGCGLACSQNGMRAHTCIMRDLDHHEFARWYCRKRRGVGGVGHKLLHDADRGPAGVGAATGQPLVWCVLRRAAAFEFPRCALMRSQLAPVAVQSCDMGVRRQRDVSAIQGTWLIRHLPGPRLELVGALGNVLDPSGAAQGNTRARMYRTSGMVISPRTGPKHEGR